MSNRKSIIRYNSKNIINANSLISKDFFEQGIEINRDRIFPILVMGTMSSGKSTLINALLEQSILPSKNEACTSKIYTILDDDNNTGLRLYITDKNGNTIIKNGNNVEELLKVNCDSTVSSVLIKGHIKEILYTDKKLLIIDTPGPNNTIDLSHKKIMLEVLDKVTGGLILYVMNATQMGINDDKYLLQMLNEYLKTNMNASVLFVINKIDEIDEEKESLKQLILDAKDYLVSNGFKKANLIPISASAACIFNKVLNGEELTRREYRSFIEYYELYMPKDFNMKLYTITEQHPYQFDEIEVRGKKYLVDNIIRAIDNTGIKILKDNIKKTQILSSK